MLPEISFATTITSHTMDDSKDTVTTEATLNSSFSSVDNTRHRSSRRSLTPNRRSRLLAMVGLGGSSTDLGASNHTTGHTGHSRRSRSNTRLSERRGTVSTSTTTTKPRSSSLNRGLVVSSDHGVVVAAHKVYAKEDNSKEARRARRRRHSVCHVEPEEDNRSVGSSKSLKQSLSNLKNPFQRKHGNRTKKRLSSEEQMLQDVAEMEKLVQVIQKNPESRKLLYQHLNGVTTLRTA